MVFEQLADDNQLDRAAKIVDVTQAAAPHSWRGPVAPALQPPGHSL